MHVRKGVKKHNMHIKPKSSKLKLSKKHSIFEDKKSLGRIMFWGRWAPKLTKGSCNSLN